MIKSVFQCTFSWEISKSVLQRVHSLGNSPQLSSKHIVTYIFPYGIDVIFFSFRLTRKRDIEKGWMFTRRPPLPSWFVWNWLWSTCLGQPSSQWLQELLHAGKLWGGFSVLDQMSGTFHGKTTIRQAFCQESVKELPPAPTRLEKLVRNIAYKTNFRQ